MGISIGRRDTFVVCWTVEFCIGATVKVGSSSSSGRNFVVLCCCGIVSELSGACDMMTMTMRA